MPLRLGLVVWFLLLSRVAGALDLREQYEERLIHWGLTTTGLVPEPDPAGKTIERIEIAREDVIAASDPWPRVLNFFHATTRDVVVRRELLVTPGEVWNEERIEESARNLRRLPTLAVVRPVACKGSRPDRVVLLMVTKDLWSIRLNMIFGQVGSVVQELDFRPAEDNFLGRAKSVRLHIGLKQLDLDGSRLRDQMAIGAAYFDPRLGGSRLQLTTAVDVLVAGAVPCGGRTSAGQSWCPNRRAGQFDGTEVWLELERPLFSLATAWGFDAVASANVRQRRRFVYNSTSGEPPPGETTGLSLDTVTFDADSVPAAERTAVPRVFDVVELWTEGIVKRSFGRAIKHDLTGGAGVYRHQYTTPDGFPFDEATRRQYQRDSLPQNEDAAYAIVGYRDRATRYVRLHDIQSFALTEDFLLGHDVSARARLAANLGTFEQSFIDLLLQSRYRWYLRDDLLTVWLNAQSRWQPRLADLGRPGPWANTTISVGVTNVSPRFAIGRAHAHVCGVLRRNDLDQDTSVLCAATVLLLVPAGAGLGGDTGLRGYPSNAFEGLNLFQANLEYRTLPINIFTLHLGGVVFYDGGAAFGGADPRNPTEHLPFRYHHSVGVGVRGEFPQFDKHALRIDFGVPLRGGADLSSWFSFSFQQVF